MSTLKVNALQHTNSSNSNLILDGGGNLYANVNLTVNGSATIAGSQAISGNQTITGNVTISGRQTVTGNVAITANNVTIGGMGISPYIGMRNRIINGDFRIDQRFFGTANNGVIATRSYVVDRWHVYSQSGSTSNKLRYQQNNTNGPTTAATRAATGFSNFFGANVVSANTVSTNDYYTIIHIIEGLNIADFAWGTNAAQPVTLSFWVYTSVPGLHGGTVQNFNQSRGYGFTYTVNAANTWQYQTITIPGETSGEWFANTGRGIDLAFGLGVGTTFSRAPLNQWANTFNSPSSANGAVSVVSAANGSFYLTGVQLEKGSVATPFEFRHITTELQLCQRYYTKSGQKPGSEWIPGVITNAALDGRQIQSMRASTDRATCMFDFPVTMRAQPTLTFYPARTDVANNTAGFITLYNGNTLLSFVPSLFGGPAGIYGSLQNISYSDTVNREAFSFQFTADAEIP